MRTRVGKIARLPAPIREQLNQKLFHGVFGKKIVSWLNALPEVNHSLAEQFASHPISENNLSEWRRGGYQDWLREKETQAQVLQWVEKFQRLEPEDCLRQIEKLIAAQFAEALQALRDIKDADVRSRRFHHLCSDFARMQNRHTAGLQSSTRREQPHSTPISNPCPP